MRSATGTAERDAVPMLLEPAVVSTDSGRSAGVICQGRGPVQNRLTGPPSPC